MATFQIFEDQNREKENTGAGGGLHTKVLAAKNADKRQTLAVLGNVLNEKQRELQPNNDKLALDNKVNIKNAAIANKKQDENIAAIKAAAAAVASCSVPVDRFEVFKDDKQNVAVVSQQQLYVDENETANTSKLREPLQEIKVDDTPVSKALSPMSVDALVTESPDRPALPINDRDRFFEVEEYQVDILTYLKSAELKHRPKPTYMRKQPDLTHTMRTILVDWLVEVGEEYRLHNETLYLAVSYVDRFLSYMSVVRAKLQLVGTAAMFIAAKYEEIYPPDVGEFVYITDDTYTRSQVLRMEQFILKVLGFDLSVPSPLAFITLYCIMNDVPEKVKNLTMYLCELSLLDGETFLQHLPSKVAAASLALARYTLEYPIWSTSLERKVGYSIEELKDIVVELSKLHNGCEARPQHAIQEKYKSSKYLNVGQLNPVPELTDAVFQMTENNENVRKMISSLAF